MKKLILFIVLFSSFKLFAQDVFMPVNFDDCGNAEFFIEAEKKPEWMNTAMSLSDYLNHALENNKDIKNVKNGKLFLGIFIGKDGIVKAKSFTNLTKVKLDPQVFRKIMNDMPKWKPAEQKDQKVNFVLSLPFSIKNGIVSQG